MKKLTIIHSNDLHGDFLPEENGNVMTGGVARLSGYINKVRSEEENVVYCMPEICSAVLLSIRSFSVYPPSRL